MRPRGNICRHGERCDRERVTVALADVAALPSGRPSVANKIAGGRLPLRFCDACRREWTEARAGITRGGMGATLPPPDVCLACPACGGDAIRKHGRWVSEARTCRHCDASLRVRVDGEIATVEVRP